MAQRGSGDLVVPDPGKIIVDGGNFVVYSYRFAAIGVEELKVGGKFLLDRCIVHCSRSFFMDLLIISFFPLFSRIMLPLAGCSAAGVGRTLASSLRSEHKPRQTPLGPRVLRAVPAA